MPRTYSENSEPRKVYQADTIRDFTEDEVNEILQGSKSQGPFNVQTLPLAGGVTEEIVFTSMEAAKAYANKIASANTIILQFTSDTANPDEDPIIANLILGQAKLILQKILTISMEGEIASFFGVELGIFGYKFQATPTVNEGNNAFYISIDIFPAS